MPGAGGIMPQWRLDVLQKFERQKRINIKVVGLFSYFLV